MCTSVGIGAPPLTVIDAEPATLFAAVAMIVVVPAAAPVARPVAFTVAVVVLPLDQVKVAPGTGVPLASVALAVNCCVPLTRTVAVVGATVTVATGPATMDALSLQTPNVSG